MTDDDETEGFRDGLRSTEAFEEGVRAMNDFVEALRDEAESMGVEVREDYSGRGMYGARCFALVGEWGDLFAVVSGVGADLGRPVPQPQLDAMGRGMVMYWPRWSNSPRPSPDSPTEPSEPTP